MMEDIDVVGQLQDAFMREPVGDTLMAIGNALQEVQALQQQNAALEKQNAELLSTVNTNWISVREKMPELIPLSPTTFVARSEEVLICGWVDKEFYVSTADLRLGGQGINDRAVRWNSHRDIFWGREHLISHWKQMPRKPAKGKPSTQEVSNER